MEADEKHLKNVFKWLSHDRFGFTVLLIGWKSGPNVLSKLHDIVDAKPITFSLSKENYSSRK